MFCCVTFDFFNCPLWVWQFFRSAMPNRGHTLLTFLGLTTCETDRALGLFILSFWLKPSTPLTVTVFWLVVGVAATAENLHPLHFSTRSERSICDWHQGSDRQVTPDLKWRLNRTIMTVHNWHWLDLLKARNARRIYIVINRIERNGSYWVTLLLWADWEENPPAESPSPPDWNSCGEAAWRSEVTAVIYSDSQITGIQMKKIKQISVPPQADFYLCLHPKLFAQVM